MLLSLLSALPVSIAAVSTIVVIQVFTYIIEHDYPWRLLLIVALILLADLVVFFWLLQSLLT